MAGGESQVIGHAGVEAHPGSPPDATKPLPLNNFYFTYTYQPPLRSLHLFILTNTTIVAPRMALPPVGAPAWFHLSDYYHVVLAVHNPLCIRVSTRRVLFPISQLSGSD
jgi:hypothetical protein